MKKKAFSQIKEILRDAKKGKMFILVDDGDRENEGDLVIPGSKCNSKNINFIKFCHQVQEMLECKKLLKLFKLEQKHI